MTDNQNKQSGDDNRLGELLRIAGPRPAIDSEREARIYEKVLAAWEDQPEPANSRVYTSVLRTWRRRTAFSRRRHWLVPAGLAAAAAIAVAIMLQPATPPRIAIGTISKVMVADAASSSLQPGQTVFAGDELNTGADTRLSLLLARGESLRIDSNTRLQLLGRNRFGLDSGRIYADTGDFVYRDSALVITTSHGSVTDIGTQFSVVTDQDTLEVAVREGRIDVESATGEQVALAGQKLLLAADGSSSHETIEPDAEFWRWATELAPVFDIENKSLLSFLKWVARETGMQLEFDSDAARMAAMRTDLHGSVADFAPLEALESVMATTAFSYSLAKGRIIISQ